MSFIVFEQTLCQIKICHDENKSTKVQTDCKWNFVSSSYTDCKPNKQTITCPFQNES